MIVIEICVIVGIVSLTGLGVVKALHIGLLTWEQCLSIRVRIARTREQLAEAAQPKLPAKGIKHRQEIPY